MKLSVGDRVKARERLTPFLMDDKSIHKDIYSGHGGVVAQVNDRGVIVIFDNREDLKVKGSLIAPEDVDVTLEIVKDK